jgi:hypothetical protein
MQVRELIAMLAKADPGATVLIYDGDAEEMAPVGGMIYGGSDKVELLPEGYD